jgi:hypothetical protein
MTTEIVLLLGMFAFLVGGAFFGEHGPLQVFSKSGPRLAARIEKHVTVGREWKIKGGQYNQWQAPDSNPPDGKL